MRTHGRKRRILLHDSDFRGKFRIVQHFSCRNAVFPPIPYPPNRLSRHFRATTGVCDVARFQKMTEKWNRATFTECRTCRNRQNHVTMARKTHSRLHFSYISTTRASLSGIGTKSPGNITISYMSAKNN